MSCRSDTKKNKINELLIARRDQLFLQSCDEIEVSKENGCIHIEDRNILLTATEDVLSDCDYEYNDPDSIYICRTKNASETFEKNNV